MWHKAACLLEISAWMQRSCKNASFASIRGNIGYSLNKIWYEFCLDTLKIWINSAAQLLTLPLHQPNHGNWKACIANARGVVWRLLSGPQARCWLPRTSLASYPDPLSISLGCQRSRRTKLTSIIWNVFPGRAVKIHFKLFTLAKQWAAVTAVICWFIRGTQKERSGRQFGERATGDGWRGQKRCT